MVPPALVPPATAPPAVPVVPPPVPAAVAPAAPAAVAAAAAAPLPPHVSPPRPAFLSSLLPPSPPPLPPPLPPHTSPPRPAFLPSLLPPPSPPLHHQPSHHAPGRAGVHANLLATTSPSGVALLLPETFVVTAALSLNSIHDVADPLLTVPKVQRLLPTVVDPSRSPTGSELAHLHAFCTGHPSAVNNPFGFVGVLKLYVPSTTPHVDGALARVEAADKAAKLLKKHCGSDRDSLIDAMLCRAPAHGPPATMPSAPAPACPIMPPAIVPPAPTHARTPPATVPPASAPACPIVPPAACRAPTTGLPVIMPPPFAPPPTGPPVLPPARRHRPVAGLDAVVATVQQKCPGTAHADARARTISMLKGRCTACALPRSGTGQNTRCLTPGCVRTHLHPTTCNEVHAIWPCQIGTPTLTPTPTPDPDSKHIIPPHRGL